MKKTELIPYKVALDEKTNLLIFGGRVNLMQIQRSKFAPYLYVGNCNANLQINIASKSIANSMICYKFTLDLLNIPNLLVYNMYTACLPCITNWCWLCDRFARLAISSANTNFALLCKDDAMLW